MTEEYESPLIKLYGERRISDRSVDELMGLCRGIVADCEVNQKEAEFLLSWMEGNLNNCKDHIVNQLYRRVQEMLCDGFLDKEEQEELLSLLSNFTGKALVDQHVKLSSQLPLCEPAPHVVFDSRAFCLTGTFAYGPRKICEEVVRERGGDVKASVSGQVDYLVVGTFSSPDWIHSSYGRKIQKALDLKESGCGLSIVSEDHWSRCAFK